MADSLLRTAMAATSNGLRAKLHDTAVSGTLGSGTPTATPMNTTDYDPLSMATVTNPAKITVDIDGYYIVSMRTSFLGGVDLTRMIAGIWVNRQGAGFVETVRGHDMTLGSTVASVLFTIGMIKLQGGDAVEGVITVTTASSTTTSVSTCNTLELCWIGPL